MNWQNICFDWNQVRAFLVTAEEGSLSAAARAMGATQPTLGRQVAALEDSLGVTLFERTGRSMVLTRSGRILLDHVRAMGDAAAQLSLAASGQAQSVEGPVSITASDAMSAWQLPPVIDRLRDLAPGITVDLVPGNDIRDLRRREADIALRHARPEQPDLIARRLRDTQAHLWAARRYLARAGGHPATLQDLARMAFVGFDATDRLTDELRRRGLPVTRDQVRCNSANGALSWQLVRQGLGIGVMTREVGDLTPEVEMILPDAFPPIPVETWLTTHRELHTSRPIRMVFDLLAETFG
ncbi:LysR family transcriptional regulator [Marinibacterium profundimaris]|uniref:LysR family transcriptional regulator n=1 Tax=Marinibacterium profundimaris TaxID=1679460 RepID=A0A225NJX6_9RHOB|nr:LysR family transcriptional regulator [Marinibacterium profundimaris]OWU72541.1 LysR family transcriptional regulator [Marinibacterium profundimaris]